MHAPRSYHGSRRRGAGFRRLHRHPNDHPGKRTATAHLILNLIDRRLYGIKFGRALFDCCPISTIRTGRRFVAGRYLLLCASGYLGRPSCLR